MAEVINTREIMKSVPHHKMSRHVSLACMYLILSSLVLCVTSDDNPCGSDVSGVRLTPHQISRSDVNTRCCIPKSCPEGYGPKICTVSDPEPECVLCGDGYYNDGIINSTDAWRRNCKDATYCRKGDQFEEKPLTRVSDRVCACDLSRGFYKPTDEGSRHSDHCYGPVPCGIGQQLSLLGECENCTLGTYKDYEGVGMCKEIITTPEAIIEMTSTTVVTTPDQAGQAGMGFWMIFFIVALIIGIIALLIVCCCCRQRIIKLYLNIKVYFTGSRNTHDDTDDASESFLPKESQPEAPNGKTPKPKGDEDVEKCKERPDNPGQCRINVEDVTSLQTGSNDPMSLTDPEPTIRTSTAGSHKGSPKTVYYINNYNNIFSGGKGKFIQGAEPQDNDHNSNPEEEVQIVTNDTGNADDPKIEAPTSHSNHNNVPDNAPPVRIVTENETMPQTNASNNLTTGVAQEESGRGKEIIEPTQTVIGGVNVRKIK